MNASTWYKADRLCRELDRKINKLRGVTQGRDKCLKSIEKLKRHIENVKREGKK